MKFKLKEKRRDITLIIIIAMVLLLFFTGYSFGKALTNTIIKTTAEVAEPILIIENNPSIDITALKNKGYYDFKIKNYDILGNVTQTDLDYSIEILASTDESIEFKLYKDNQEVEMKKNKTKNIHITRKEKQEHCYQLQILYDKTKSTSIADIIENVQIKVHSEQTKA